MPGCESAGSGLKWLLRRIGQAETIDTLADATGVNRETVRSQLKSVLSKTGLSRQQELVSLLAGKALPGG